MTEEPQDENLDTVQTLEEIDDPDFPTDEEIAAEGDPDLTDDDGRVYKDGPDGEVWEAGHEPSPAAPSDTSIEADDEAEFATDDEL